MTEKSPNHPSMRTRTVTQEEPVTGKFREAFMDLVDTIIGGTGDRSTRPSSHPSQA